MRLTSWLSPSSLERKSSTCFTEFWNSVCRVRYLRIGTCKHKHNVYEENNIFRKVGFKRLPFPEFEVASNPGMIQTPSSFLSRRRNIFCGILVLMNLAEAIISAHPLRPLISYCWTHQLSRWCICCRQLRCEEFSSLARLVLEPFSFVRAQLHLRVELKRQYLLVTVKVEGNAISTYMSQSE